MVGLVLWSVGRLEAQDDLYVLETTLPAAADRWYMEAVGDSAQGRLALPFANFYAEPSLDALVLGEFVVIGRHEPYLHMGWDYRASDADTSIIWREDVGDWGYGIYQFVSDVKSGWVLLPPGPQGDGGWVQIIGFQDEDGFVGSVYSIAERLVRLDSVTAEDLRTGEFVVTTGTVMIESIENGMVTFRPEIPSDMPCDADGDTIPDPPVPMLRAPTSSFLTEDELPRFEIAYPKGC